VFVLSVPVLGEEVTWVKVGATTVCVAGAALVSFGDHHSDDGEDDKGRHITNQGFGFAMCLLSTVLYVPPPPSPPRAYLCQTVETAHQYHHLTTLHHHHLTILHRIPHHTTPHRIAHYRTVLHRPLRRYACFEVAYKKKATDDNDPVKIANAFRFIGLIGATVVLAGEHLPDQPDLPSSSSSRLLATETC
jgi:hypothetical protein